MSRNAPLYITALPFKAPDSTGDKDIVYDGPYDSRPINLNYTEYAFKRGIPEKVCGLHARKLLRIPGFREFLLWEKLQKSSGNFNICIIREGGLGDVLMTIPVVRKLSTLPNVQVTLGTISPYVDLFTGLPFLKEVIPVVSRLDPSSKEKTIVERDFDVVRNITFEDSKYTDQAETHRIDLLARCLGITFEPSEDKSVTMNLKAQYFDEANHFLNKTKDPLVTIQLRSVDERRTLNMGELQKLSTKLVADGFKVVLLDQYKVGWDGPNIIRADGAGLSLGAVCALIAKSKVLVGTDSGLSVVGAALKKKVVVGMSQTPAKTRFSTYKDFLVLQPKGVVTGEPIDLNKRKITADRLYEAVSYMVQQKSGQPYRELTEFTENDPLNFGERV